MSIGGPFFGLVLQEDTPQRARSTLAPFFLVGSLTSLLGLAWLPFMALGAVAAQPVRHHIDHTRFKRAIFALATLSALSVIARVLL